MNNLEDFLTEAIRKAFLSALPTPPAVEPDHKPVGKGIKIKGIRGLAAYLECSASSAQKMKNAGKFPFYEVGNRLFFWSNEIDQAIKAKC